VSPLAKDPRRMQGFIKVDEAFIDREDDLGHSLMNGLE
jgi:hypothetical protein